MDLLAVATLASQAPAAAAAADSSAGLQINFFWILVSSANFLVFLVIIWKFALGPVDRLLEERREKVEQGLKDADAARLEREQSAVERMEAITEAHRQANDIVQRAQKAAEEARERDLAATRAELERLRVQAAAEIEAEKQRAIGEVRAQIADLALLAAGRVVGETMSEPRERRLVEQFLTEIAPGRGPTN